VASLSQGRTAAAQCGLFTHKSVPVIFEPPCIYKWFLHLMYLLCPCWWPSKGWNVVDIIIVSQGNLEEIEKLPIIAFCW